MIIAVNGTVMNLKTVGGEVGWGEKIFMAHDITHNYKNM